MTLREHIDDIRNRLKKCGYVDETAISNQVVVRLLSALKWPIFDEWTVIYNYPVWDNEIKKVDLTLCHPLAEPIVFIEIKAFERFLTKSEEEKAENQLIRYIVCFQKNTHKELPIALLTDGQKWRFFHPMGKGNWEEHPVREFDIIKSDIEEIAKCLKRYLNYNSILKGEVKKAISDDYQGVDRNVSEDIVESSPHLRVTMPNGQVVEYATQKNTFVEVIVKLGLENVARNRPKIVKAAHDKKMPPFKHYCLRDGFYINTDQPLKWERWTTLVSIGRQLGKLLKVERIEK